jgi:hypothetical protein
VALMSDVRSLGRVAVSRGVVTIALIVGFFLLSAPAWAQISLVHVTSCGPQGFPSSTCTIPSTSSGNLLVVAWTSNNGSAGAVITSMADNANNVYAEASSARAVDASANSNADVWYSKNIQPGATVVTVTPSPAGTTGTVVVWEFSGADPLAPLDQTAVLNSQLATTMPSGAPVTTRSASELVISVANIQGAVNGLVAGSLFSSDSIANGNGWAHLIASSVGTYQAQWNNISLGTYAASTVSFKATASGSALNACDLNADGANNILDVNLAVNMTLGQSPCTANVTGPGVCTVVTVQRIVNSTLPGGACVVNTVSVMPAGLSCTPSSVNALGSSACTGTLSGAAPSGGLTLTLSSNNTNVTVPSSVTAAAGATTFGFTATVGSITTNQTAVLAASANGASPTVSLSLAAPPQAPPHSVTLTWIASTSSNVAGYNVYRGTTPGGPYATKVNSSLVTGLSYIDTTVLAGQTYYYVVTSVNTSSNESAPSTQVAAVIPTP